MKNEILIYQSHRISVTIIRIKIPPNGIIMRHSKILVMISETPRMVIILTGPLIKINLKVISKKMSTVNTILEISSRGDWKWCEPICFIELWFFVDFWRFVIHSENIWRLEGQIKSKWRKCWSFKKLFWKILLIKSKCF